MKQEKLQAALSIITGVTLLASTSLPVNAQFSNLDPTNPNSIIRRTGRNLDPTNNRPRNSSSGYRLGVQSNYQVRVSIPKNAARNGWSGQCTTKREGKQFRETDTFRVVEGETITCNLIKPNGQLTNKKTMMPKNSISLGLGYNSSRGTYFY